MDPNQLLVELLTLDDAANTVLDALDDEARVYGVALPPQFDIADGNAIVVSVKGGMAHAEIDGLCTYHMQVRVWAGERAFKEARTLYGVVQAWLHGKTKIVLTSGTIVSCLEVAAGQDVTDPDTGWATVVSVFELLIRS